MNEPWESVFGEVPEGFSRRVSESLSALPEREARPHYLHRRPMAAVAAAAATILLLGGTAFATDLFGLRSIQVADVYKVDPEDTRDIVALQGYHVPGICGIDLVDVRHPDAPKAEEIRGKGRAA